MIGLILAFIILTVLISIGISQFRGLNGQEKWQLTKILAYATMCSLLSITLLTALVVLF
jgi:hypothetical protein